MESFEKFRLCLIRSINSTIPAMLRLSRPAKRNALDDASSAGIESPLRDPPEETRTIILHAEGKHFMAGEFAQSGRLNELVLR